MGKYSRYRHGREQFDDGISPFLFPHVEDDIDGPGIEHWTVTIVAILISEGTVQVRNTWTEISFH